MKVRTRSSLREQDAARAWRLMFDFLMRSAPQRIESLQKHDLTPNDSRALFALKAEEGRPIGTLAQEWKCDPSTATWLVDRLERAGLAERLSSETDRRVKLIRLTKKGAATTRALMAEYYRPPTEITALSPAELRDLIALLEKL